MNTRCIDGKLYEHRPQRDDPNFEVIRVEHAVLRFWVPVYVTIKDDQVTDVHVDDGAPACGYHDVQPDPDLIEGEGDELRAAAIDVAFNHNPNWPAWEFGW